MFFHDARYTALRAGLAVALQAPPAVLVAEATFVNVVWPHAFASSETTSPVAPFETAPDIVDCYEFRIDNGRLILGKTFSVSEVDGTGADAQIHKYTQAGPGQHIDGIEAWLYPLQPPR